MSTLIVPGSKTGIPRTREVHPHQACSAAPRSRRSTPVHPAASGQGLRQHPEIPSPAAVHTGEPPSVSLDCTSLILRSGAYHAGSDRLADLRYIIGFLSDFMLAGKTRLLDQSRRSPNRHQIFPSITRVATSSMERLSIPYRLWRAWKCCRIFSRKAIFTS